MKKAGLALGVALCVACGRVLPPPDGKKEVEASRKTMLGVTHFTLESTSQTAIGTFRRTYEVDCARDYYHMTYVADLTDKGVESRTSRSQGRPRPHLESEELYVDGQSYVRYSGSWESPPPEYDDAQPNWEPSRRSFAESADCARIHQEADLLSVPYSKLTGSASIEFVGRRTVNGMECNEFRAVYEDTVFGDRMITRNHGEGSSSSEREMVKRPVEAKLCIGATDRLAYRTELTDIEGVPATRQFSYDEVKPLPAPGGPR